MARKEDPAPESLLMRYQAAFRDWQETRNYSPRTILHRHFTITRFIAWCADRGLSRPQDITRPILERYQRHVYLYRKPNGAPLGIGAQINLILPLKAWFKWLTKQNHILYNPAADLDLPRVPKSLPKGLLSVAAVEMVLNSADMASQEGLRMRAILETLYSTGIRRMEAVNLKLFDVDLERGALMVRQGKGLKDRFIPVGARACAVLLRYLHEVRPLLAPGHDDYTLFLDDDGAAFTPQSLGVRVKRQLVAAGITQGGACHLFRHACATHMLENGADIRYIQVLLGHAQLTTTEIYTQVSLVKLKEVHSATHPARLHRDGSVAHASSDPAPADDNAARQALLDALQNEAVEDEADAESGAAAAVKTRR